MSDPGTENARIFAPRARTQASTSYKYPYHMNSPCCSQLQFVPSPSASNLSSLPSFFPPHLSQEVAGTALVPTRRTDPKHALFKFPYLLQHLLTGDGVMGASISTTRRPGGATSLSLTISARPVGPGGLGRPKFPADAVQRAVCGIIMERAAACRVTDLDEAEIALMLGIISPVNNGLWSRSVYTSASKEQMRARIDVYEVGSSGWCSRSVTAVLYQILLHDLRSKYETREVSRGLVLAWEGGSAVLHWGHGVNTCGPRRPAAHLGDLVAKGRRNREIQYIYTGSAGSAG